MENIFDNDFGLLKSCSKIEELFSNKKSSRTDLFSIVWVTEGMIDLLIDDIVVPLNVNQMTFITPVKYVKIAQNHGQIRALQFSREFYCIRENDHEVSCDGILYFGAQGVPIMSLEPNEIESFNRLHCVLKEEFEIEDSIQEEMLRALLKRWLIKSTRILKRQNNFVGQNEVKAESLRQFKILLEKNYKRYHKVSDYAVLLNKSPKTIANQFKILGQESPSTMIYKRILIEAKRYLLYSQLSIKEIAHNLGFVDGPTFSHFFKRNIGLFPLHFRDNKL